MNEVGELIFNRRKALGLTLEEVGNAVGVSKSTVKKWESGGISNMRRDKIEKLAKILEISPIRLLGIKTRTTTTLDESKYRNGYWIPSIGLMLIQLRRQKNYSKSQLGEIINVNEDKITKWENGYVTDMSSDELNGLAKALCFSPEDLDDIQNLGVLIERYDQSDYGKNLSELQAELQEMLIKFMDRYYLPKKDPQESSIIESYNELNSIGKGKALERIEELTMIPDYKK